MLLILMIIIALRSITNYSGFKRLTRVPGTNTPRWHSLSHNRSCSNYTAIANMNARVHEGFRGNPHVIAYNNRLGYKGKPGKSIVVRTGTNVSPLRNHSTGTYAYFTL